MRPIRFIFALHNHQPIGNFENLFEQSYQESYLPFLKVFAEYPDVKLTLHTSGPLMEWLTETHPEYVDQLAELVAQRRVEIMGGPFFEPILAMIPSRDRIGQIQKYTHWLQSRLGAAVQGMWTPERVWEQSYLRDIVAAGMRYTILDDFHFRNAGLSDSALWKHYLSEDDGKTMHIFPGSERLRYLIPFRPIEQTLEFFAQQSELHGDAVLVHGDDGEKFGNWPNTYAAVFEERWLHRFFQTLCENASWLITTTPSEVLQAVEPRQSVYLPDASYREMTEWVLAPENQLELTRLGREMEHHENWQAVRRFIRGGFWRNFKVRYPESNEMYARMMHVSSRLAAILEEIGPNVSSVSETKKAILDKATEALYRGQCNCAYWHGAFGGVYLPHLRNAVYAELLRAEEQLDLFCNSPIPRIELEVDDFNFDAKNEVKLSNEHLALWFAPHKGGMIYEWDWKPKALNFLAGMNRSPEAYHALIQRAAEDESTRDQHGNPVVLKHEGLHRLIQYDWYARKSLIDLFYDMDVDFAAVRFGHARQHGSFFEADYSSVIRKNPDRMQLLMSCDGDAYGARVRIRKAVTLTAGEREAVVSYHLENLPQHYAMHFAVELNFAALPGHAEDRYFETLGPDGDSVAQKDTVDFKPIRLGNLSTNLDLYNARTLSLIDRWLDVKVQLEFSRDTDIYAFPIESVNQSEGGFELVHQSVCVQPHWKIAPDETGSWNVEFRIGFENAE